MEEGRRLQRISRTAKDPVKLRWAIVMLMSAQGQTVRDITTLMRVGEDYVRDVIHAFTERGFDALDPKWSRGRSKTISEPFSSCLCGVKWQVSEDVQRGEAPGRCGGVLYAPRIVRGASLGPVP
ncbi:helix-turn-helix domain-containing protein [Streptomyces sp. WAC08241]|uniref:helix-turn-helix domain-containing protein n=1 Tax=Streptomyces sp. WAC08241 TaxID=2487421 RepID=UPI0021B06F63|nr:helix-turn-helix domain-containing protein [Streptomyces sp. WAC08241]